MKAWCLVATDDGPRIIDLEFEERAYATTLEEVTRERTITTQIKTTKRLLLIETARKPVLRFSALISRWESISLAQAKPIHFPLANFKMLSSEFGAEISFTLTILGIELT